MVFHRTAFQFKSDASRKPFRRAPPIFSRHPNLKFKAARMPEWLHLLGVGLVLAGCGWIAFAPATFEWFWTPEDNLAVIIIGPRVAASCDAGNGPPHGA
jgi:hypothetical protein